LRWITAVPPDRDGGGGHVRQAQLLRVLAERHDVHLLLAGDLRDAWVRERLASCTSVDVAVRAEPASRSSRRLDDLAAAVWDHRQREVRAHDPVRAAIAAVLPDQSPVDVTVVEFAGLADLVDAKPRRDASRWVCTLHNLGSGMARQAAAAAPGRRQRWLWERDATAAARLERSVMARFDQTVAVSDEDAARLHRAAPDRPVPWTVPNGVDLVRYRPSPLPAEPAAVFTGALYTAPNQDGVVWLCDEILPALRALHPAAEVGVVGARPLPPVVEACARAGVPLHADVDAVVPFLERARVALVPLRIGTGTRLKALEALAGGRPVVGTSIGLGGLGLADGRHALFADDAADFAAAVDRLFRDDALAAELATEGRKLVEARYGWDGIAARFADLLESLVP
jgi:glycosyltransferase involved in cell wall biosynthesis